MQPAWELQSRRRFACTGTLRIMLSGIGTGSIAKIMHNSASFTLDLVMAECDGAGRLDSFRGE